MKKEKYELKMKLIEDCLNGEYQSLKSKKGAYWKGMCNAYREILDILEFMKQRAS